MATMSNVANAPPVRGVVFDLDGTLVLQRIDFEALRRDLGLPSGTPILEAMADLPDAAWHVLDRHERDAAALAELLPGVVEFLTRLDGLGVPRAVLTRNSRAAAEVSLARCGLTGFAAVLSREDAPFKPDPGGLLRLAAAWGLAPAELLMVGDFVYDVRCGRAAGARTALLTHGRDLPFAADADLCFRDFAAVPAELWRMLGA